MSPQASLTPVDEDRKIFIAPELIEVISGYCDTRALLRFYLALMDICETPHLFEIISRIIVRRHRGFLRYASDDPVTPIFSSLIAFCTLRTQSPLSERRSRAIRERILPIYEKCMDDSAFEGMNIFSCDISSMEIFQERLSSMKNDSVRDWSTLAVKIIWSGIQFFEAILVEMKKRGIEIPTLGSKHGHKRTRFWYDVYDRTVRGLLGYENLLYLHQNHMPLENLHKDDVSRIFTDCCRVVEDERIHKFLLPYCKEFITPKDKQTWRLSTVIRYCIVFGKIERLQWIASEFGIPISPEESDVRCAAEHGRLEMFKFLLEIHIREKFESEGVHSDAFRNLLQKLCKWSLTRNRANILRCLHEKYILSADELIEYCGVFAQSLESAQFLLELPGVVEQFDNPRLDFMFQRADMHSESALALHQYLYQKLGHLMTNDDFHQVYMFVTATRGALRIYEFYRSKVGPETLSREYLDRNFDNSLRTEDNIECLVYHRSQLRSTITDLEEWREIEWKYLKFTVELCHVRNLVYLIDEGIPQNVLNELFLYAAEKLSKGVEDISETLGILAKYANNHQEAIDKYAEHSDTVTELRILKVTYDTEQLCRE